MNPAIAQGHQGGLGAVMHAHGAKDGADVHLYRSLGHAQLLTDQVGGFALG